MTDALIMVIKPGSSYSDKLDFVAPMFDVEVLAYHKQGNQPGLYYLIKHSSDPKLFLKIFIHHMDADGQGFDTDYLSGPFEGEVDVQALRLIFKAESLVALLVTAPNNLSTGYDSNSDAILNEVEGAYYSGFGTDPQVIAIPSPLAGIYRTDIFGTRTGSYTITVESIAENGSLTDRETWTGELDTSTVQFSQDGDLKEGGPSESISEMLLIVMLASAGIIIALTIYVLLSRRKRKQGHSTNSSSVSVREA